MARADTNPVTLPGVKCAHAMPSHRHQGGTFVVLLLYQGRKKLIHRSQHYTRSPAAQRGERHSTNTATDVANTGVAYCRTAMCFVATTATVIPSIKPAYLCHRFTFSGRCRDHEKACCRRGLHRRTARVVRAGGGGCSLIRAVQGGSYTKRKPPNLGL